MTWSELGWQVAAWLITYAVHSTLLILGIALLLRWRPPASFRLQERMWRLALLGGLVTASLQSGLGWQPYLGSWSLRADDVVADATAATSPEVEPHELDRALAPAPFQEEGETERREPRRTLAADDGPASAAREPITARAFEARNEPARLEDEPGAAGASDAMALDDAALTLLTSTPPGDGSTRAPGSASPWPMPDLSRLPWRRVALAAWGLAGALGVLLIATAWSSLLRRIRGRSAVPAGEARAAFDRLREHAGIRGRVAFTHSEALATPITLGIVRPEVCVPTRALTHLTPGQLESMLAHELAHTKRRDPAWFALMTLVERVFVFQPLNRIARRQLQDLAELQCDDQAVRWTGHRLALASCLTEVATWLLARKQEVLPAPTMAGSTSRLGQRVERLLDDRRSPYPEGRQRWWAPTALGALGIVVLAVPGVSSSTEPARRPAPIADPHVSPDSDRFPFVEEAPAPTILPGPEPHEAELVHGRSAPVEAVAPEAFLGAGLSASYEMLEAELELLTGEVAGLEELLVELELETEFADRLANLRTRVRTLEAQRERLRELMPRVLSPRDEFHSPPDPDVPHDE